MCLWVCMGLMAGCIHAQTLYTQSFGKADDPALIFLHGGPGYNCAAFEYTTAAQLAKAGFFVLVYDRRGEGRSPDPAAAFTFEQSIEDLLQVYAQYELSTAHLIGHSFGGVLATQFALAHPKQVSSLILVGAPIQFQASFQTIIDSSRHLYEQAENETGLFQLDMLEAMDSSSLYYSSGCFMQALNNGFYTVESPTPKAQDHYRQFETDSLLGTLASQMTQQAPIGFWQNHRYTTMDITAELQAIIGKDIPVYGLYGAEDGLYGQNERDHLVHLIGESNLLILDRCAHNVFIDQQLPFIQALTRWYLE